MAAEDDDGRPAGPPVPEPKAPREAPPRDQEDEEDEEDFARMLEDSLQAKRVQEGETVEGVVVALWPDVALVDVGGKGEATIDIEELRDAEGDLEVEVGDRIQAIVVATDGGLKLSRRLARSAAAREQLSAAFRTGLPVEGRVDKAIKGGYEVRIAGLRAFCPISQIDLARTDDPAIHAGRVYAFRIIEYRNDGKDLVVSRRALLEEEQREKAEEVKRGIVPDAVLEGRVVSVREYGAFVDLGAGVQGLLHVSEMGWSRVSDPSEVVRPGQEVTVKVLRVDEDKGRISLGLKQLERDPWSRVAQTYAVGQVLPCRVTRLTDFGAFVELQPGVEALAHASSFPPTSADAGWRASVAPGTTAPFEILSIDVERKRIGVALVPRESLRADAARPPAAADREASPATAGPAPRIVPGARIKGKVERLAKFGVFVYLAPGRTGLIHMSETGVSREGDLTSEFPIGSEIEVVVLEVDPATRRIGLSRKAVWAAEERADAREYASRQDRARSEGFGSLADKLRDAMKRRDR